MCDIYNGSWDAIPENYKAQVYWYMCVFGHARDGKHGKKRFYYDGRKGRVANARVLLFPR
jgi:hypothetical protein